MKQWQKALEQLCSPERPIWIPELRNDIELYIKVQDKTLQQQAETIELLKNGMKGDYDLDQWLDWAISKKHMMETIERLREDMNKVRDALLEISEMHVETHEDAYEMRNIACETLNKLEAGEL